MNINRNNYESYFIDYIDGILTSEEVRELDAFLLLNDDLNELLECQSEMKLETPHIEYGQKQMLKKDKLHGCPDYYAIATVENSLTTHDKEHMRKHPVSKEDIVAYQKIRLNGNTRVHYPNKEQLYHRSKISLTTLQRYISAAVIVLLVGISYMFYPQQAEMVKLSIAQTIVIPSNQVIESKQIVLSLTIKEQVSPLEKQIIQERIDLSITELHCLPIVTLSHFIPDYSLITQERISLSIKSPEIYLTAAAHTWKGDGVSFLSDNIIISMRDKGRAITQRFKIKYLTNNNRDDYTLH